jgi:hypothetical protein
MAAGDTAECDLAARLVVEAMYAVKCVGRGTREAGLSTGAKTCITLAAGHEA